MRALHIKNWVSRLTRIPPKDLTLPRVQEFIEVHPIWPETLAPYLFNSEKHYTRSLICRCDLFEVLAVSGRVECIKRA
jgi:hypothetical protein